MNPRVNGFSNLTIDTHNSRLKVIDLALLVFSLKSFTKSVVRCSMRNIILMVLEEKEATMTCSSWKKYL